MDRKRRWSLTLHTNSRSLRWLWLLLVLILLLLLFLNPFAIRTPFTRSPLLINVTLGAVTCPYSLVVGWTLGHDWSSAPNAVTCAGSRFPVFWFQVWWGTGQRTSLCLDPGHVLCHPHAEVPASE